MDASHRTRIIHATQAGGIGGVSRVVQVLSQSQKERGCDVIYAYPPFFDTPEFHDWFGGSATLFSDLFVSRTENPKVKRFLELVRWLRSERPDVLHVHSGSSMIHPRLPLAGRLAGIKRVVVTIHHICDPSEESRARRKATVAASKIVRAVVATTETMSTNLVGIGVSKRKVRTIYLPIPNPGEPAASRGELRRRLGVSDGDFVVGSLARFVTQGRWDKGQGKLIEVAQIAAKEIPNLKLVLAGDGPDRAALQEVVAQDCPGLVLFPGYLDSISQFYPALDLFAHLSSQEGFGLVFGEAALYGVPVLGTRVGGVPTAVEEGVSGWLMEYGDVEGAANLMVKAYKRGEDLKLVGIAAEKRARRLFAVEPIRDQYFDAYGLRG
jgi:glycosyltransferase involved in cell wall biosynthesis